MKIKQKHVFALCSCFFVHHSNNDVWICNHVAMCHAPESIVCACTVRMCFLFHVTKAVIMSVCLR